MKFKAKPENIDWKIDNTADIAYYLRRSEELAMQQCFCKPTAKNTEEIFDAVAKIRNLASHLMNRIIPGSSTCISGTIQRDDEGHLYVKEVK